jgi:uroporphyrin-III C-methyltransferase/precorrin-2 dehydrogenase/sirohydrochlorin ferrochelatase
MRHFPAFFDLFGRAVLIVGDTRAARQRFRLAKAAGAEVRAVTVPTAADLSGAALAFIATGDADSDRAAAMLARLAHVPANVVDRPELCDFVVPAIVDREDVVIGIGTGGASPILARWLRGRIEDVLPGRLGALARLLAGFRDSVRAVISGAGARRRFWEQVMSGPIAARALSGDEQGARAALLGQLNRRDAPAAHGEVSLVGAGPGDPGLLTLRALQAMQAADVILHDELVTDEVLALARREAELICVGKQKGRHSHSQDEINALLLEQALAGRNVVRLKGGDPFVFGRGGEERDYLARHGIAVSVVPGVTAALGCAAAAGIPLTHRDHASAVTFVTGHLKNGLPAADWRALVQARQTLVIYMGLSAAGAVRAELMRAGLAPATPVAIVARGTRPDQSVRVGTLDGLTRLAAGETGGGPALIIVGDVAALADVAVPALAEAS